MQIKEGMLDDARVIALLETHLRTARVEAAPGSARALGLSGLKTPDIRFWSIWDAETLLGVGALKHLNGGHGELKSMHVASDARRRGMGGKLLQHILSEARSSGLSRLGLETGSWDYFRPAVALYSTHGFSHCEPFGDYRPEPNSIFMTLSFSDQTANAAAEVEADG
ncbi:GNAT family N-acetyltransferase [Rhizobium lusitanum]|uniref:GNAT family N-acetyltransferase n=2 Tax=Rhizobium lusitanum TaxID=293958 RepID=A0A6L9UJV9_9HYPH|nr:GNAT family N-acetyltransferase [Rhizobium lusitanum]NEI74387.1 GNAT family N-acetyltransferase [Rhizobium lusitanum]